ncbi:hypothetical protein [Metabacillus litoralis]|uniref:hypothetical protein n=1 Tax=Metabacillus litoralis TaxID=152268 RepID=UPI001CFDD9E6|nr:hypothetical protein [Metabacillus litoralis]
MQNKQLVQETIQSLTEFLPKIAEVCILISEDLRADKESEALSNINDFINAMEWSTQAINGIISLGYNLGINTNELNDFLKEAQEGLEVHDYVLVADMFEYEFVPSIENWINKVKELSIKN